MFFRIFLCLVCTLFPVVLACAHQVPSVELEFQQQETQWRLLGEMDIAYMLPETRNIPGGPPLSRAAVMKYPPEEFARIRRETDNTLHKLLRFSFAGKDVPWRVEFPDFEKKPFALPPEDGDIALLSTRIIIDPVPGGGELRIHWAGEQETELIILIEEGEDPKIMSTLPGGNLLLMNLPAPAAPAGPTAVAAPPLPAAQPTTGGWLQSGFHHVLPTGFDHMLFILGLFLLVPKWRSLVEQSLLFTLAHSVTLALSVYGLANVPANFVNIMVAVSIAWIGVENLIIGRTGKLGKQRLILVFAFGLIHGLGYASGLREKLSSLPQDKLILPLIGFNAGVELAQITVLCAAFLFFWPLGKWKTEVQTYGSVFVALAGFAWTVQRLFFV